MHDRAFTDSPVPTPSRSRDRELLRAPSPAERFVVEDVNETTLIVRDTLTRRVRESTHDFRDACAIASILNGGFIYAGGEPEVP